MGAQVKKLLICMATGLVIALGVYTLSQTLLYYPFLVVQSIFDDSHFIRRFTTHEQDGAPDDRIIIVDIDDRTLSRLGSQIDYWPRSYFADVVGYLARDGARAVFLDILFAEGGNERQNRVFADSVRAAGQVVTGYYVNLEWRSRWQRPVDQVMNESFPLSRSAGVHDRVDLLDANRVTLPYHDLVRASTTIGYANYQPDFDGVLRHIPLFMQYQQWVIPSASLQLWLLLNGYHAADAEIGPRGIEVDGHRIPTDRHTFLRISYPGATGAFTHVPFSLVESQLAGPGLFEGKIVLIGSSAEVLGDLKRIPGKHVIPGVEVHAAALHTMLSQQYIRPLASMYVFIGTVLIGMIAGIVFRYTHPLRWGLAGAIGMPLILYVAAIVAFSRWGLLLNTTIPGCTILSVYLFIAFYQYVRTATENGAVAVRE